MTEQHLKIEKNYIIVEPDPKTFTGNRVNLENLPKVSFCIPVYNSSRTLEKCLKSIVEQEYPDIEIIIVDNGSKDSSVEIAQNYTDNIYYDDGLLGSVRQTSLENSTGEIIALIDSDIYLPHKNWLVHAITYFNYGEKVSTVWPVNIAPPGSSWTTRLYFNLWKVFMDHRIANGKSLFGGGNALFLRNCLEEIGGINQSIHWGEDFEWAQRLKNQGYQVVALEDPLYHDTMNSLGEFARKQFIASETFTKTGFEIMGLSKWDLFYENFILGTKFMFIGIIFERDFSWLYFPLLLTLRSGGYFYNVLRNLQSSRARHE